MPLLHKLLLRAFFETHATLKHISGWLDVLHSQIHLRLAAVVRGVSEGPAEHFDPVACRPSPISSILLNCAGGMAAKSLAHLSNESVRNLMAVSLSVPEG